MCGILEKIIDIETPHGTELFMIRFYWPAELTKIFLALFMKLLCFFYRFWLFLAKKNIFILVNMHQHLILILIVMDNKAVFGQTIVRLMFEISFQGF